VDRAAFTDGPGEHDPLRDRGLPHGARTDGAHEVVVAPRGLLTHGRNLVHDDARQVELVVVGIPHVVDGVGDGADAAQAE